GRDGAGRRRRTGARLAVGKELGMTFVQSRDGVAEVIGGEDLHANRPSLRVVLHERKLVQLVAADVEFSPARGGREAGTRYRQAEQAERVAERREHLAPARRVRQLHHHAERLEQFLAAGRGTRPVIDSLYPVGEDGG